MMAEHQNNEPASVESAISDAASDQLANITYANRESFFANIASHTTPKDIPTARWTKPIAPVAIDGIQDVDAMERVLDECRCQLDASDELDRDYQSIIVDQDYEALQEKSGRKSNDLLKHYRGQSPKYNLAAQYRLNRKLNLFRAWTEEQSVIRSDSNGGQYDEFKSPRIVGEVASFGVQDIPIQADRYVYASLDDMPHYMASHEASQVTIDIDEQDSKAELVMVDVADMRSRHPQSWLAVYLSNLFDLKNGKKILAIYLATVFKNIEEAKIFLGAHNHPNNVQHWDEEHYIQDVYDQQSGERVISRKRSLEIQDSMKRILSRFGIEPPLSLEVRIPEKATISKD